MPFARIEGWSDKLEELDIYTSSYRATRPSRQLLSAVCHEDHLPTGRSRSTFKKGRMHSPLLLPTTLRNANPDQK